MIAEMNEIIIVGPHALAGEVVKTLQHLGTVHITESSHFKKYRVSTDAHQELGSLEKKSLQN